MKSINLQNLKAGGEIIKTEAEVPTKMSELEKDISLDTYSVVAQQVKYNWNEDGTLENIEDVTMSGSDIFNGLVDVYTGTTETLDILSGLMPTYPKASTLICLRGDMNEVHSKLSTGESNENDGKTAIYGPILMYIIDWNWTEETATKKVRTATVRAFGCEYSQGALKYNYVIHGGGNKKDCIFTITESSDTEKDTYDVYISDVVEVVDLNEVKGQIKTITYDNTTLKEHLAEIISYTNIENGGTLLSIGFKTSTASVLANATKATIANAANPVVATTSQVVLKPATFYSFRSADIESNKLTLNGPNGIDGCSSTNLEITTATCSINGCGSTVNADGAIEMICFKDINLLEIPLEHLVIDYFTV